MYGLTFLVIRLLGPRWTGMRGSRTLRATRRRRGAAQRQAETAARRHCYVIAIVIGLAVPVAAVVFYFGIAVYAIVPFRKVAGLLFGRS